MNIFLPAYKYNSTNTYPVEHLKGFFKDHLNSIEKEYKEKELKIKECSSQNNIDEIIQKLHLEVLIGKQVAKSNQEILNNLDGTKEKNITLVSEEEINDLIKENKENLEKCTQATLDICKNYPNDCHKAYKDIEQTTKDLLANKYNILLTELGGRYTYYESLKVSELILHFNAKYNSRRVLLEKNLLILSRIAKYNKPYFY